MDLYEVVMKLTNGMTFKEKYNVVPTASMNFIVSTGTDVIYDSVSEMYFRDAEVKSLEFTRLK